MDSLKNHRLIVLLNELPKPFLMVWFFVKDVIKYIFELFFISWKALCFAMNKNALLPGCIAAFSSMFLFYLFIFLDQSFNMDSNVRTNLIFIFFIINILPVSWGYATVSSVIKSKSAGEDDYWKQHVYLGFESVRFFLVHILLVLVLLFSLIVFSYLGKIPQLGQSFLGLLTVPFYFISLIIILTVIGLILGTFLFGGYYLSGDYNKSGGILEKTKSLTSMVSRKIIDWVGITFPMLVVSFLFIIIPTYLTVISVEFMKSPSEGLYGVRFPDIYSLETFHTEYPEDYEVEQMQEAFNAMSEKRSLAQKSYDNSSSYNKRVFIESLNNSSWNNEEKWSMSDKKILLEETSDWTGEEWTVKEKKIVYSQYDEVLWLSDERGEVQFVGSYDSSFFIFLAGLILVFASSVILAIPLGCFYTSSASVYYHLYRSKLDYSIIKRVLGALLLPSIFLVLAGKSFLFYMF